MEDSFVKTCNITYDRFFFFSSKPQRGESIESFKGRFIEHVEKPSLDNEETTLIRDTFILNMLDCQTQKELHKQTVTPTKALETARKREHKISKSSSNT